MPWYPKVLKRMVFYTGKRFHDLSDDDYYFFIYLYPYQKILYNDLPYSILT